MDLFSVLVLNTLVSVGLHLGGLGVQNTAVVLTFHLRK